MSSRITLARAVSKLEGATKNYMHFVYEQDADGMERGQKEIEQAKQKIYYLFDQRQQLIDDLLESNRAARQELKDKS